VGVIALAQRGSVAVAVANVGGGDAWAFAYSRDSLRGWHRSTVARPERVFLDAPESAANIAALSRVAGWTSDGLACDAYMRARELRSPAPLGDAHDARRRGVGE
jgi:hypothetical protein